MEQRIAATVLLGQRQAFHIMYTGHATITWACQHQKSTLLV